MWVAPDRLTATKKSDQLRVVCPNPKAVNGILLMARPICCLNRTRASIRLKWPGPRRTAKHILSLTVIHIFIYTGCINATRDQL